MGGINITAIGGGTGLSTLLKGLKEKTSNITAVVAVSDDGGGSGVLRNEMGMLPPGDIRNCIMALADVEPTMKNVLNYRFTEGSLKGQSFGNLFIAALNGIYGRFDEAVRRMGDVLAITGKVLPVTTSDVQLHAEFENGNSITGESKIYQFKKEQNCRISRVSLLPSENEPLQDALDAIANADLIVLGPGSLYTSVIPNLLVPGIVQALINSQALKIYVCNVMTEYCETDDYTAFEHVSALMEHSDRRIIDLVLVNSRDIPKDILVEYIKEGAGRAEVDKQRFEEAGIPLAEYDLLAGDGGYARHDPRKLANALLELYYYYRDK